MAYATLAEVRARMAHFVLGAETKPTDSQVALFIAETDAELNTILGRFGVTTPVTTPASFLAWLVGVSSNGVTAAVLKSMFPDSSGPGETPAYAFFEKRYRDALKLLLDGKVIPDELSSEDDLPSTYFTRNPEEEEDLGGISEPTFKIAKTF